MAATLPNPIAQIDRRIDLGSVQHAGDNVASPNYGQQVGGHIIGLDQSVMNITTKNDFHMASGVTLNVSSGAFEQREAFNAWLNKDTDPDFEYIHRFNISQRQEGTGSWLLEQKEFIAWRDSSPRTLWCYGIPGSGKTIMSSIVIEHLEDVCKPDTACLFIFFDHRSKAVPTVQSLLLDLLRQLVSKRNELSHGIQRLHTEYKFRTTLPSRNRLIRDMKQEMESFKKIWLVIDALDEFQTQISSSTRIAFLKAIYELPHTMSVFITSRDAKPSHQVSESLYTIEIALHEKDLYEYVESRIRDCCDENSYLAKLDVKTVVRKISQHARGMFLLARLHMDNLASQRTDAGLKASMETLPSSINGTYAESMQRIPSSDKLLAEQIILWTAFSMRPLTMMELLTALSTKEHMKSASCSKAHMLDEGCIASVCAGLVMVDSETMPTTLRLVHPTAETYFREKYFAQNYAHTVIAHTCIRYLLFEDFDIQTEDKVQTSCKLKEFPLLHYAALHWGNHARYTQGDDTIQMVLQLLNRRGNLSCAAKVMDLTDETLFSPLWMAAYFGLETAVEELLSTDFDYHLAATKNGETAMHAAAEYGHVEVVIRLLSNCRVEPDLPTISGRTPLSLAAENGHYAVVRSLILSGKVNPDSKTHCAVYGGRTPLSWAAGNGHLDVVDLLLETRRVDVDSETTGETFRGRTPLIWAAANGHKDVVELLSNKGRANSSLTDCQGFNALFWATQNDHGEVSRMLQIGRSYDMGDETEKNGEVQTLEVLKVMGFDFDYQDYDSKDEDGRTNISYQAEKGDTDLVDCLLGLGADPNGTDGNGMTHLMYASAKGRTASAKLLLEQKAMPDLRCHLGRTALSYAADEGHKELVELLLKFSTELDLPDNYGRTPLSFAAQKGRREVVELLLEWSDSPDFPDEDGRTPLSYAAEKGHEDIVALMIALGEKIDIDSQSQGILGGRTPLSWAAGSGEAMIVEILWAAGADVNLKNSDIYLTAKEPKEWARINGHQHVVRFLERTGELREPSEDDWLFSLGGTNAADIYIGDLD